MLVLFCFTDKKRDVKAVISVTIVIGTIAMVICTYFSWRRRGKQTGNLPIRKGSIGYTRFLYFCLEVTILAMFCNSEGEKQ